MTEKSVSDLYGISAWGQGLVQVLPDGSAALADPVHPQQPPVSLPKIVNDLNERGIATPILLRVPVVPRTGAAATERGLCRGH